MANFPLSPQPPHADSNSTSERASSPSTSERASSPSWLQRYGWLGLAVVMIVPIGLGTWAVRTLTQLPDAPTCWQSSVGQAAAATQIYCAELLAKKATAADYRQAIALVDKIPVDDPLRPNGDRLIQAWAEAIFRIAEAAYQQGDLETAINTAREIPARSTIAQRVEATIEQWETTWKTAESIYQRGLDHIDEREWYATLSAGRELLALENRYWATTRYQDLMRQLQTAKEERKPDRKPVAKASPGSVEDMIARWEREQDQADSNRLQQANQLAGSGNLDGLKAAVEEAQQILYGTPRYEQAQQAIATWRTQIETLEDRPYLDRAVELANEGRYREAINEAGNIGWGRSLYQESRDRIEGWRAEVYQQQLADQAASSMNAAEPVPVSIPNSTEPVSIPASTSFPSQAPIDAEPLPLALPIPDQETSSP
ncbi:hypothetical protein ACQ4M4_16910 [Leptolyngbya sp. AN02str]|uniref:hypothetical protein n=1 Tax=Leptolyngbya sp. AN02str TaxID=3423363 RepID=UPI003D31F6AC